MTPLNLFAGPYDWIILAVVVLVLFGGTKLAGFGKNAGRAIREFKEETQSISKDQQKPTGATVAEPVDAELVEPRPVTEQKPENQA